MKRFRTWALFLAAILIGIGLALSWNLVRRAEVSIRLPSTSSEKLIVPGAQLGQVRIGMTEPEVVAVLGRPSQVFDTGLILWNVEWKQFPINVVFFDRAGRTGKNGRVTRIITQSRLFRTENGAGVGSETSAFVALLGAPVDRDQNSLYWWGLSIGFVDSRVVDIFVDDETP